LDALDLLWLYCSIAEQQAGAGSAGQSALTSGETHELRELWEHFWRDYPPQYALQGLRVGEVCKRLASAGAFAVMYRPQWRDCLRTHPNLRQAGDVAQLIAFLGLRSCRYWSCDAALIALSRRQLAAYVRGEPEPGYSEVRLSPRERKLQLFLRAVMDRPDQRLEDYVSAHYAELKLQAAQALGLSAAAYVRCLTGLLRKLGARQLAGGEEMPDLDQAPDRTGPCAESLWSSRKRRDLLDFAQAQGVMPVELRGFWEQFLELRIERWDEWGFIKHAAAVFGLPANTIEQRFRRFCTKLQIAMRKAQLTPADFLLWDKETNTDG
jgi:hypothetical protein